jgi:flagellar hook protein FlgE
MFFDTALSGISAASDQLSIAGNNIANANTYGFKGAAADFSAILSGVSGANTGSQNFAQGTVVNSVNANDLAINGEGFFRTVDANNNTAYTRNGQFTLNNMGNLVNSGGAKLTDTTGAVITINLNATAPSTTSTALTATQYLDPTLATINVPFDPANAKSYSATNSVVTYDSLGNEQKVQLYYASRGANTANNNTYDLYTVSPASSTPVNLGSIQINPATGLVTSTVLAATPATGVTASGVVSSTNPATFSGIPISTTGTTVSLDLTNVTQLHSGVKDAVTADGNPVGVMTGFKIGLDGTITENFSNQQSQTFSQQVGLVTFAAPSGLKSLGNNTWQATSASGPAVSSLPNSNGIGSIQSSALEYSNVDMTTQLVDLLAAQRAYQANSQVIKAQDAVLQTMVNLN